MVDFLREDSQQDARPADMLIAADVGLFS